MILQRSTQPYIKWLHVSTHLVLSSRQQNCKRKTWLYLLSPFTKKSLFLSIFCCIDDNWKWAETCSCCIETKNLFAQYIQLYLLLQLASCYDVNWHNVTSAVRDWHMCLTSRTKWIPPRPPNPLEPYHPFCSARIKKLRNPETRDPPPAVPRREEASKLLEQSGADRSLIDPGTIPAVRVSGELPLLAPTEQWHHYLMSYSLLRHRQQNRIDITGFYRYF